MVIRLDLGYQFDFKTGNAELQLEGIFLVAIRL